MNEQNWSSFDSLYAKACKTSQPSDWMEAALAAQQVRKALAAQPVAVPADCDVRKIMLDVVPGWDGEGVEVYAKSVAEVEAKLGEIWAELEEWQMGIRRLPATPHTEAVRMSEAEIEALWSGSEVATRPVLGSKKVIAFARAVEQATAARLGVTLTSPERER